MELASEGSIIEVLSNLARDQVNKPLEWVHTDVCGKMSEKSIGGAEYFMTSQMKKHIIHGSIS